jgi:predicted P-loop ATPase
VPNQNVRPEKGVKGYELILQTIASYGVSLSFDDFQQRAIIKGISQSCDGLLEDPATRVVLKKLHLDIKKGVPNSNRLTEILITEAEENRFHPVKNYLTPLKWDNLPRIATMASVYFGAAPTEINHIMLELFMIAAVRRVMQPGCKFDHLIILQGATGAGKSSACAILAGEWFTDDFPPIDNEQKTIENLAGRWIVEYSDLSGMKKADQDKLKAFLSRQVDSARAAYGHLRRDPRRQCVFIGTTEEPQHLIAETNRRMWTVPCGKIDLEALRRDRDQLWAEAVAAEALGEPIALPERLWGDATEQQKCHKKPEAYQDRLFRMIGRHAEGAFTLETAILWLGIPEMQYAHAKIAVSKSLAALGYKKCRLGSDWHSLKRGDYVYALNPEGKQIQDVKGIFHPD